MQHVQPPGPKGLPLIGNIEAFEEDRLGFLLACAKEYGDIVRFNDQVYILNNADFVEYVLTRTNHEFSIPFNFLLERVSQAETPAWMKQRHGTAPGLGQKMIGDIVPQMVSVVEDVKQSWNLNTVIDIPKEMETITSRVIASFLFGADGQSVPKLASEFLDVLIIRIGNVLVLPAWMPTSTNIQIRRRHRDLKDEIKHIIQIKQERKDVESDLLSFLVTKDEIKDDDKLIDFLSGLLLAAHRVPAAALSWVWFLLSQNPIALTKLQNEVDIVLKNSQVTMENLSRLQYAEAVAKEALRLYPPTWLLERAVEEDTSIGGYEVRKGQTLLMSSYAVQRDERYFSNPHEFVPERWLDNSSHPKFAFFPFGGGPRSCPGAKLSMVELVITLATISKEFQFRLSAGKQVKANPKATLLPDNLMMIVERRSNESHETQATAHINSDGSRGQGIRNQSPC